MSVKVKGYLAPDGKFFEDAAECMRYEHQRALIDLCESHSINPENFFVLLREWNVHIKGYYNADSQCKEQVVVSSGAVAFEKDFPSDENDHEDAPIGDKDTPGFLEQSVGRRK